MKNKKDNRNDFEILSDNIESMKYLYWKVNRVDRSFCSDDIMSYILEKSNGDIKKYLTKGYALKNKIIDCLRHHITKDEYKMKYYGMVIIPMINYEFKVYDNMLIEVLTNRHSSKYNVCLEMKGLTMQSGRLDSRKISKIFNEFLESRNITEQEFNFKFERGLEFFESSYVDSLEFNDNIIKEEEI